MSVSKTITFSGKGLAGDLLDPHNWTRGAVPGINDTALITTNVGGPVSGIFSVNNVMMLGSEAITFEGTLDTAGVGACKGLMVCDGAIAIFAPGSALNDGNVLIVGNDAVGTLLAQGSGTTQSVINSVTANVGKLDDGVGTINIDDGVWRNSGRAVIGDDGAGTLNVVDNGSVMFGADVDMAASAGSSGTMTIASNGSVVVAGALRIGGASATVSGIASVTVGTSGDLTVDNALLVGAGSALKLAGGTVSGAATASCVRTLAGGVISGYGTLSAPDGTAIQDEGTIRAAGGDLTVNGDINGTGSIQIAANSTATLTGASLRMAGIAFVGADATLALAHGSNVTAALSGFAIGDIIAMANINAISFNAATGRLTLSENNAQVETLHFAGSFTGDSFALHQTQGGAMISLQHS